jgi:hypothetical protein
MNVEIGTEAAQFLYEYVFRIFDIVSSECRRVVRRYALTPAIASAEVGSARAMALTLRKRPSDGNKGALLWLERGEGVLGGAVRLEICSVFSTSFITSFAYPDLLLWADRSSSKPS